jgi:hypothetical protein
MHDINLQLNKVTRANRISKIDIMKAPFELPDGILIYRILNIYYISQCPINLISASRMKRLGNIILNINTSKIFDCVIKQIKTLAEKFNNLFKIKTAYETFMLTNIQPSTAQAFN